jgi:cell division protein FtsL
MDSDFSQFVSEIWRYKPIIIVLLVGVFIMVVLSVIDTHRHRKKIQKKRPRDKHH